MDNNLFQRLKELVEQNQTIGILVSPNPSFDQMAAGLGMYLALKLMNKQVSVVSPTDPTVAMSSLVGIDKVQKTFGDAAGNDLIVSFPYKEGEIEKVSYDVDGDKLKIVVKAGPQGLSFTQNDVQFQRGGTSVGVMPSLVFFVGVADMQSLGFTKPQGVTVVNIDNRSNNTKYGDVVHVDSKFTSLSEEVADFLTLLEPQIELDTDTSQNLLSGILAATNDFQNGQGSYLAFEMAGILMKKGAVRSATGNAHPTATVMPTANYFPPVPAPQPVQQEVQQPMQQPVPQVNQPMAEMQQPALQPTPTPNFGAMFGQAAAPIQQQPVVQPVQQPVQQAPAQQQSNNQPPADWLTPKVYKGSTVV